HVERFLVAAVDPEAPDEAEAAAGRTDREQRLPEPRPLALRAPLVQGRDDLSLEEESARLPLAHRLINAFAQRREGLPWRPERLRRIDDGPFFPDQRNRLRDRDRLVIDPFPQAERATRRRRLQRRRDHRGSRGAASDNDLLHA